jgi:hypothetical protein
VSTFAGPAESTGGGSAGSSVLVGTWLAGVSITDSVGAALVGVGVGARTAGAASTAGVQGGRSPKLMLRSTRYLYSFAPSRATWDSYEESVSDRPQPSVVLVTVRTEPENSYSRGCGVPSAKGSTKPSTKDVPMSYSRSLNEPRSIVATFEVPSGSEK